MLRRPLLWASRQEPVRWMVANLPVSKQVVRRFVAGEDTEAAVEVTSRLDAEHLQVSLDYLGEDTRDADQAAVATDVYLDLLERFSARGLARGADVSVKLTALGLLLDDALARKNAERICSAADSVGATVTLDMEDHTTTDSTLAVLAELRADHPGTGAVLQAYLHRTEEDCRALAVPGSRVRLCKGAYNEPPSVAYRTRHEVDRSYARCLEILMSGSGYPMVATHDPRLVRLAGSLAERHGRRSDSFEYQMLYGIRPDEQRRLVAAGRTVRVYVPFGDEWYGYLMRRLAERPANVTFFIRALATRR